MAKSNKFGTFKGVFTPSILTILGVIMYMRLPMIVGNAGLYATIGIIVVAHIISITTGLSVSSIATDKKVEAGGTYYMISRSLGLPIGGTLGLALFVGLSFSVSLYLIGFSESFLGFFGFDINKDNIRIAGSAILLAVTIITFISTSLALKAQYFIMAAIILSLVSILLGKHEYAPIEPTFLSTNGAIGLMVLFGIFFPAVTGFESGVSMSGDLKDPKKSIPVGSISAIVVGLIVYIGLAFFFSYTVQPDKLAEDPQILLKISRIPQLVIAGIWGATLSSALGSILGAPRILQATAVDRITPKFFAKGTGKTNEPRNALLLTFLIAESGILIGELNIIARIVSIFFITTYGFLNLSCAFEAMTSADFRPAFKTPVWISLLGSVAAMIVMIQLDFVAMLGATLILGALYTFLKRKELVLQSGDAWSGIWASLVKTGLKKLKDNRLQNRNWRPNIIMFSGNEEDRPNLVQLGKNMTSRLGMMTGFNLIETDEDLMVKQVVNNNEGKQAADYFMNTHYCRDLYSGMDEVIRVYGYTGMEPNTVLMGWSKEPSRRENFIKLIDRLGKNNFNSLFLSSNSNNRQTRRQIDVWWSGWGNNLSFAINLVRHITNSQYWKEAEIRLFVICNDSAIIDSVHYTLKKIIAGFRIDMEVKIINNTIEQLSRKSLIVRESANSELTIIGIPNERYEALEKTYLEMNEIVSQLNNSLLINASDTFEVFNLLESKISERKEILKPAVRKMDIPELTISNFPEIASEIKEIDKKGSDMLDTFLRTALQSDLHESFFLSDEIKREIYSSISNLKQIKTTVQQLRREKILNKVRSEFLRDSQSIFRQFLDQKQDHRKEMLTKGIEIFIENFDELINGLPKKLKVAYMRSDFYGQPGDNWKEKRYKRRKLILHPFAKKIRVKIKFRKIFRLYLQHNSLSELNEVLSQLKTADLQYISGIRNLLTHFIDALKHLDGDIHTSEDLTYNLETLEQEMTKSIQSVRSDLKESIESYGFRLRVQFRKELQKLNTDLNTIYIHIKIRKNLKLTRNFRKLLSDISGFHESWGDLMINTINKVYLDLLIHSAHNQVKKDTEKLKSDILTQVKLQILNPVDAIKSEINSRLKDSSRSEIKMDASGTFKLDLLRNTDYLSSELQPIIENLPEEIQIMDYSPVNKETAAKEETEPEIILIPIRRIVQHYLHSIFLAPLLASLQQLSNALKSQEYRIKDHISLMSFEKENLDAGDQNYNTRLKEIYEKAFTALEEEEQNVLEIVKNFNDETDKNLTDAFEPIASHRIAESSRNISYLIREYHGKQTVTKFDTYKEKIQAFLKSKMVRLLYYQSEGILFAKRLSDDTDHLPSGEQVAELVDQLMPNSDVLSRIPAYYTNLFSGKSSIGKDFWIDRKTEEEQFKKALDRYRRIRKGGILIYGNRNSGKTTLCKFLTRKHFNQDSVFHIYPPVQGSVLPNEFEKTLQNVFGINLPINSLIDSIGFDSVLVFHDMELWWERSESGMQVINIILDLIQKHSDKLLIIANLNIYTYHFLNSLYQIDDVFLMHILCRPFDSEDLKELVMRRHRSSGKNFSFGKRRVEQVSEIKLAGIFNRIFRITGGNPGLAMITWLSMINDYNEDNLEMRSPKIVDSSCLDKLDEDWMIILAQIVLHKRITLEKLEQILGQTDLDIRKNIDTMVMSGMIAERNPGVFVINNYIFNVVCEVLENNGFI